MRELIIKCIITVEMHTNVRSIVHLLLPSSVTRKLLIRNTGFIRIIGYQRLEHM